MIFISPQVGQYSSEELMFDHIKFGVSNYAVSKSFFLKALEPLGVTDVTEWPPNGVELSQPMGKVSLCLHQTEQKLAFAPGVRSGESSAS